MHYDCYGHKSDVILILINQWLSASVQSEVDSGEARLCYCSTCAQLSGALL